MRKKPISLLLFATHTLISFSLHSLSSNTKQNSSSEMLFLDTSEEEVDDDNVEVTPQPQAKPQPSQASQEKKAPAPETKNSESSAWYSSDWDDLEPSEQSCTLPQWGTLGLRHIEGKGVGYNQGYTSLDAFLLIPIPELDGDYALFFDARGHIFDDGKLASNIGLGGRILRSHIHTVAAYYDYRETHHDHYNQLSLNYENLGKQFDWRANGYFPVGSHTSKPYGEVKFHSFEGHSMILSQKQEFAMWGINAEIGKDLSSKLPFQCYGAIGPYYYGRSNTNAWGGQVRLNTQFNKYIKLECNASYDNIFHGIAQAQLSLVWPLGPMKKKTTSQKWCSQDPLMTRVAERVERNEIIVTHHDEHKSTAIDPATGQPYFFWFVNNTSHSQGTYESPFNTLVNAEIRSNPGDIIYVYPGNGTDQGMDQGFLLKDNQRLLGSSTPHPFNTTKGMITVPASTKNLPQITNLAVTGGVLFLSDNNEISGFSVRAIGSDRAIVGGPFWSGGQVTNVMIDECSIVTGASGIGIYLVNNTNLGEVSIFNCNISAGSPAIQIEGSSTPGATTISNSNLSSTTSDALLFVSNFNYGTTTVTNCTLSGGSGSGCEYVGNLSIAGINISNCSIFSTAADAVRVRLNDFLGPTSLSNCSIVSGSAIGINFDTNDLINVTGPVTISNCSILSGGSYGVSFTNNPTVNPPFRLNLFNNIIENPAPSLAGFLINNPNPLFPDDFILDVHGNQGTLSLPNPLTLIGP